ncbi:hypothetical protein OF897_15135 [Chryseobacterium formosus]|uniref:Uncharacterized protein n=1 Tax=Chryseobacterium formosus TaxID=1537363 RepID=A0ABT3XUB2_9FLAO|nr:hypothetical protein [Chryseobacterium formosus]MCX8525253.1 hypothetical protein [Chryseobacterium formosus]
MGVLLLFTAVTAKGQQNLNMLAFGGSGTGATPVDVSTLTSIFGDVTMNGVVRTTDTAPNNSI